MLTASVGLVDVDVNPQGTAVSFAVYGWTDTANVVVPYRLTTDNGVIDGTVTLEAGEDYAPATVPVPGGGQARLELLPSQSGDYTLNDTFGTSAEMTLGASGPGPIGPASATGGEPTSAAIIAPEPADETREQLIQELKDKGIKHTPEDIIWIIRDPKGKIIFLETGSTGEKGSGMAHILEEHEQNFKDKGIPKDKIDDLIQEAVKTGKKVGTTGKNRPVYEVTFEGKKYFVGITIGSNGYVVGANPVSEENIKR